MIARTIRKTIRNSVLISIFIPALSLAVVADSSQLSQQSAVSSAGGSQEELVTQLMVKPR